MSRKILKSRVFTDGAARYHNLVYILSKDKSMMEDHIPHTSAVGLYKGKWGDCTNTNWNSTAIAVAKKPTEKLVFVGEDGEICTYVGGVSSNEDTLPKVSMIRCAETINGYVYVCGMKRQVYKRTSENQWIDISAPFPKKKEKVGFESIDGFSEDEIYAVGWKGEIWQYDGSKWLDRGSLTNLILTSVCCAPDGVVYIVGQQGMFIKGRHDTWEIVEWEDEIVIDFWDLSFYQGKLYISTMTEIYTFEKGQLIDVDFGGIDVSSCYGLTQAEDIMWSIGGEDVLSFDGKTWQKYT
jgi:hypothetical protein